MTPELAILIALLVCLGSAAALACAPVPRRVQGWLAFIAVAGSALLVVYASGRVWLQGPGPAATYLAAPGWGFALRLHVDGLSALFLCLIALVAVLSTLYSIDYLEGPHYQDRSTRGFYPPLLVFIAGMYGLVTTPDMMWFFFIFWQLMTLPGYALIRFERDRPEPARAALKYLLMMELACLVTLAGAALLVQNPGVSADGEPLVAGDFEAVRAQLAPLLRNHPVLTGLAFGLFLVGFAIKLGTWPFGQVWLPDAHPAAPAPISALLSGVMIKTGLYGLLRYFIWIVPPGAEALFPFAAWGAVLVGLGVISMIAGTVQAIPQNRAKRLLAFSSIGQGGYLLLGLGTALWLFSRSEPGARALAGLALLATLLHTVNHACIKSLLFLNVGTVFHTTGTDQLDALGGLAPRMRWTCLAALVASLSIAGVPLTNGFVSKWGLVVSAVQAHPYLPALPIAAALAVLTSALTLAAFAKLFGATFLGQPHSSPPLSHPAPVTLEPGATMRFAQATLLLILTALGFVPALGLAWVSHALRTSTASVATGLAPQIPLSLFTPLDWGGTPLPTPLWLAGLFLVLIGFAAWITRAGGATRRRSEPWLCGYASGPGAGSYSARHYLGALGRWTTAPTAATPPPPTPPGAPTD